eukprot:Rmarinus@m.11761
MLAKAKSAAQQVANAAVEGTKAVLSGEPVDGSGAAGDPSGDRVPFQHGEKCLACEKSFDIMRLRYNCRRCGGSFCAEHTAKKGFVKGYGQSTAVRICDSCYNAIGRERRLQRVAFRAARVNAFLAGKLSPFESTEQDTHYDKAKRGCGYALAMARALPIGGVAGHCIKAVDFVAKYGILGVASVVLRKQLMEAVDTLRLICGNVPSLSVQDVSGGLYYLMANKRGERGSRPDEEAVSHTGCPHPGPEMLDDFLSTGPHALSHVYLTSDVDIQRMVRHHGHELLFVNMDSMPEKPAFYVSASKSKREAILCVRGTKNIQDCFTDLRAVPTPFPNPNSTTHAHAGMNGAAHWLVEEVGGALTMLRNSGYKIVVTGHSLGASCAVLTSILLKPKLDVTCLAYAVPACVDETLAAECKPYVRSLVLRDDVVPRTTPRSAKMLAEDLVRYRDSWRDYFHEDISAVKVRIKTVWAPKSRASTMSLSPMRGQSECNLDTEASLEKIEYVEGDDVAFERIDLAGGADVALEKVDLVEGAAVAFEGEEQSYTDLEQLYVPGTIMHIYEDKGRYSSSVISTKSDILQEVALYSNMLDDHRGGSYWDALRELKFIQLNRPPFPPPSQPFFSRDTCVACDASFTWKSTSSSPAQQNLDRYICRCCGGVCCKDCSLHRIPLPAVGIIRAVRVCDKCFYSGLQ